MAPPVARDDAKLVRVGASLLLSAGNLGLFHYNKLVFLFEYLFIRNFGQRYTKEVFVKLPHGPVIVDYKRHLVGMYNAGVLNTDVRLLRQQRSLTDDFSVRVNLEPGPNAQAHVVEPTGLRHFVDMIVTKYSKLTITKLEEIVYRSEPLKAYVASPYKKSTGSYILTSDLIRMKDQTSPYTEGRRLALDHLLRYPLVNVEQQRQYATEFADLQQMRPGV